MKIKGLHSAGYLAQIDRSTKRNASDIGEYSFGDAMSEQIDGRESAPQEEKETVEEQEGLADMASYQSMISSRAYYAVDKASDGAASECEVKHISYENADYAKISTEKGVVYKAQVFFKSNQVYVEQKKEDGTVTGYLVDRNKIPKETSSAIEKIALEAWEQERAGEETDTDTDEKFKQALEKFYAYAEDRVKHGPPKFAIGASELSVEEWDRLIQSVDRDIDTARQELRERVERETEKAEKEAVQALIEKRKEQLEKPYSQILNRGNSPAMEYNGVTFHYDEEGALCLGDTGSREDCIIVYLEDGGTLKVNRDNIGDLSKAISMFSPEDINRILRAISEDAKCREKLKEIEDAALKAAEEIGGRVS